jgi:adenylate kinase family enzyme
VDLARVVVVGTSSTGKTTFAGRLAARLGSPHLELDALYWGPGWKPRPSFQDDVAAAVREPRWVVDGNYAAVRDVIWLRATTIVWLDYPFLRVFSRALRRTVRRIVSGEPLYGGSNRETIATAFFQRDGIPWWVIRTYRKRRREYPEMLGRPQYAHAAIVRLRGPAAADAFLAQAALNSTSPPR